MIVLEPELESKLAHDAGSFNDEEYARWTEQMREKLRQEKP